jgi:tRNA(fMet)-specific endonuclease VapC
MAVAAFTPPIVPLYLMDTNILVHYVRRDVLGQHIEANYSLLTTPVIPLISVVTEGELRAFALKNGWGHSKIQQLEYLLTCVSRVSIDDPGIITAYAAIDAFSERIGITMGKNDCWIAATANVTGSRLLTTDLDFEHLSGVFLDRDWIDPQIGIP